MYFSKEILAGISLVCVGVAGVAYLYSRRKIPTIHDCAEQKITEDDLERQLKLCEMRRLALEHHVADEMYNVKQMVKELQLSEVKTKLNSLEESVAGLMQTAKTIRTAERIPEHNFDECNFGRLKTRVMILEREVTKIKIQALSSSVKPESGEGAAASEMTTATTENCFERTKPNAQTSTSLSPTGRPPTGRPPAPRPLVPRPIAASWYNNMIVRSRLREAEKN